MCSHEKTKTTFTILRTACEGGLPNYCCFTVVGAFCFCFFFFGTIILFLFICVFFLFFFFVLKLCVGRDIYMDETTLKILFLITKVFLHQLDQFTHLCLLISFILYRKDCRMATETCLMFSTTNINAVQIKYEYQVMLLTF